MTSAAELGDTGAAAGARADRRRLRTLVAELDRDAGSGPPPDELIAELLAPVDRWLARAAAAMPGLAGFDLVSAAESAEHDWIEQRGELRHLQISQAAGARRGAVVFAHGLGDHVRRSLPLAAGLAAVGWDVVMPDRRGHGLSAGRRGDATIAADHELLEQAIAYARRRFGGPVVLIGDSLGGVMGWYLLTREPDIEAAVCHCIGHPDVFPDRALRVRAGLSRGLSRLAPAMPVPVTQIADYSQAGLDPLTASYFEDRIDPLFEFSITTRAVASYAAFRPPLPWGQVRIPVLVTVGDADGLVPREYVERCLEREQPPATTFMALPGMGHQLYLEHLRDALPPLAGWLAEQALA